MIIYGSPLSPYVRKTIVYCLEKGVDFESDPMGLGKRPDWFLKMSPFGKIPAFKDDDFEISDSSAIVAYIEAKHPEPNLIPTEPKARARTVWFEEYGDTIVAACSGKIMFNRLLAAKFGMKGDPAIADEAERVEFPKLMDYLETVIPASGFLVEDRLTLADIAVVSPLVSMGHASCHVKAASHPKVAAYVAKMIERPSFAGQNITIQLQLAGIDNVYGISVPDPTLCK